MPRSRLAPTPHVRLLVGGGDTRPLVVPQPTRRGRALGVNWPQVSHDGSNPLVARTDGGPPRDGTVARMPDRDPTKSPRRASRRPEVLAPAGDESALAAALFAGADAVYFGLEEGF